MMKKIRLGSSSIEVGNLGLGCMRLSSKSQKNADELVASAIDNGMDFFDHADIYGVGESEKVFAAAVKNNKIPRDKMILQSKCGIHKGNPTMFDFSYEHIIWSVDNILTRLNTDYLDILLLHRPDVLMEEHEIARAFHELKQSGKVREFGVSNFSPYQTERIKRITNVLVNQLQFSVMHTGMIDSSLNLNMKSDASVDHDNGIYDYCALNNITIQAWSPLMYGFFDGNFVGNEKFPALNIVLNRLSEKYGLTPSAVAISWLLRLPNQVQPIVGTTSSTHLVDMIKASSVLLTRSEWYELYLSAGNILP